MAHANEAGALQPSAKTDVFRRYELAVERLSETKPPDAGELLELLTLREEVAEAIAADLPPVAALEAVARADERLIASAPWLAAGPRSAKLAAVRRAVGARASSWWWRLDELDEHPGLSPVTLAIAGALLAAALALMADVAVRMLSGGVDALGVAGTLIQGFLALLAGGALTAAGRRWFARILQRRHVPPRLHGRWVIASSAGVLLLASIGWWSLRLVSRHYSDRGAVLQSQDRLSEAIDSYARALRANPENEAAHHNMAWAEEALQNRESAIVHYRAAIARNSRRYHAYNNLARLHILSHDAPAAIELLERGLAKQPSDRDDLYTFHKNLAWAYLDLGLLVQADREIRTALRFRDGAAAHCLQAQVLEKRSQDAGREWQRCLAGARAEKAVVEPVWVATATERVLAGGLP
ncbi:MAG TPA: tetratricopeptide repeat protein [Thermoanaerobaculia bacterium]